MAKLLPLVECLHEVGCGRDKSGNRQLFMDQYCLLMPAVLLQSDRHFVAWHPASLGTQEGASWIEHPDHPVRVVRLQVSRHPQRGHAASEEITLATNLVDVPADVLAVVYQHRWTIELFFRFFKHVLGCRHLLSHDPVGIQIQTYCAMIVCLLISLWTGRKPTLRTFEMIQFYFSGWAD